MATARWIPALALLLAACGGLVKDTEKGIHTTENEVKGSGASKSVEQGAGTLKKDVTGKGRDGGAPVDGIDASPAPTDTKI